MADQVQDRTKYKCAVINRSWRKEEPVNLQVSFIQIDSVLSESQNVPLTTFWVNMGNFITCSCDVLPCIRVQMLLVPTVTSGKTQPDRASIANKRRCVIRQNHPLLLTLLSLSAYLEPEGEILHFCLPRSTLRWARPCLHSLWYHCLESTLCLHKRQKKKTPTDFKNVMIIIVLVIINTLRMWETKI